MLTLKKFRILALLVISTTLLIGCEKDDIVTDYSVKHNVIFEEGNNDYYELWSHHPDSTHTGYTKIPNGYTLSTGDVISYEFTDSSLEIELNRKPFKVTYFFDMLTKGIELEPTNSNKNLYVKHRGPNGYIVAPNSLFGIDFPVH